MQIPGRRTLCIGLAAVWLALVAACGDDTSSGTSAPLGASQDAPAVTKADPATTGPNLIALGLPWTSWSGAPSPITFDAGSGALRIPADSQGLTYGMHAQSTRLDAGREYLLSAQSDDPGVAVHLFLFDASWALIPITDADTGTTATTIAARPGDSLRFSAPAGVAGFYVQVQGSWQSPRGVSLVPALAATTTGGGGGGGGGGTPPGNGDFHPASYTRLVFADEFDGTSLDRGRWCTRMPQGGGPPLQVPDAGCTTSTGLGYADYANATEQQRFRDFNTLGEALHQVGNGTLRLRATRTGTSPVLAYEAALIRSKTTFLPTPGRSYYVTSRIKLPRVLGTWPSGVLFPTADASFAPQWPPELDLFEGALNGGFENEFSLIMHGQVQGPQTASGAPEFFFRDPAFNATWTTYFAPTSLRDRWAEVGAEWSVDGICYFVDGVKTACENYRWVTNAGATANPATLTLYLAVGGPWAGRNGIEDGRFPTALEIDRVRVYEGDGRLVSAAGLDRNQRFR